MRLQSLTRALLAGELRAYPGRAILAALAIAIGVALGYAVHLINYAAVSEFTQATRALMGNADLELRGARLGFDENIYPRVARLPEVAAASPLVEVDAKLTARIGVNREPLKILGIDIFRAAAVQPNLIGHITDGAGDDPDSGMAFDSDALFLSPAALAWLNVRPGDSVDIQVGLETVSLRIAGTLPAAGAGRRLGVMDIGAAQWRLQRLGLLQRIDLKLKPGVDVEAFKNKLAALLPAGVVAMQPDDSERRSANLSRAYRVNLTVLALVALFTGAFLVFSTQALSVVRRRAQFALLRVLGVTRGGLLRRILLESALVGASGAALGLLLGYATTVLVLEYAGADLGGGYFPGVKPEVRFAPLAALIFFTLGLLTALLGSLSPALEAAHAHPAQALKAGDEESALRRLRSPWPGLALLGTGALLTLAGPVNELPIPGYIAIALLLTGGIVLMPRLAHHLFALLPLLRQTVPYLALAQLQGAPGRASIGLGGILASFSLVTAMAIMVSSFRISVDQWLNGVLPAELYVRAASSGDTGFFSPAAQSAIAGVPGVARAEFVRVTQITLDATRPPVTLISRRIDAMNPATRLPLVGAPRLPQAGDPLTVWVSEAMVDLYGFEVGRRVTLPLAGKTVAAVIGGVWRDYGRQHGTLVMNESDYRQLSGDQNVNDAALWLTLNTTTAQLTQRLRVALDERVEIAEPGEIRALSLKIFDRSFAVTYLLEAVAIVIGLFGVAAGFSGQALARAREFGILRHLGVTRRQVGAMLALEGALLTLFGALAGLALGWVIALILIHVVNPQSFHWSMDLHPPFGLLALLAGLLVAASAAAALFSGRRAMSVAAVQAVREDW